MTDDVYRALAALGTATVYEAAGRFGLIDLEFHQIIPGSRAAGPARTVQCGQDDNLMVHAAMAHAMTGDVIVVTMPHPAPVGVVGELLATQAKQRRVAAMLIDASVRDVEELQKLGLPIWARYIRVRGATKTEVGTIDEPVLVGGATIRPGDAVVLDADGAVVVVKERLAEVLAAAQARQTREEAKRARLEAGELSYDMDGLRAKVESAER